MKIREQRRQRRPLGSVFVGPNSPKRPHRPKRREVTFLQKRSLAGAASCLLHNMVALLAEKGCQMGSKYTCQIWQKTAKKRTKLTVNRQNGTRLGQ